MKNKNKNYNKSFNRYEVKDKTSKFVKEKLPAYVLALMMVFWTIASVLGIVAFVNRDKKESALNVINASADEINRNYALRNFDIPLYGLIGFTIYEEDRFTLQACPYIVIRDKQVWVVPQFQYYEFLYNDLPLGSSITAINGAVTQSYIDSYGFFNYDDRELIKTVECYALTPFNNNSSLAYDYFYPADITYKLNFAEWNDEYVDIEIEIRLDFVRSDSFGDSVVDSTIFRFLWSVQGLNLAPELSPSIEMPFFKYVYDIPSAFPSSPLRIGAIDPFLKPLSDDYYWRNLYVNLAREKADELIGLQLSYDDLLLNYNSTLEQLNSVNEELNELRIFIDTYAEAYAELESLRDSLQEEIELLEDEIATLEEQIASFSSQLNAEYEQGKRAGYVNGYDVGYAEGALNANEYTFDGLLSSVFDVPVRVFKSLFNFELLGVNLANFFLSLLTLAIIIFIVRWIL